MYAGVSSGVAASVLSFCTNLCATVLVGYKAWCVTSWMSSMPCLRLTGLSREARMRLRQYIVAGPVASQMEKVFALLVESGAVYCAIWVCLPSGDCEYQCADFVKAIVVAWQIGDYQKEVETNAGNNSFWDIFGLIINSALVPLIVRPPMLSWLIIAEPEPCLLRRRSIRQSSSCSSR